MDERWLPVVGYEDLYEVSDRGGVRSLPRQHPVRGGGIAHRKSRVLRPYQVHGHLQVCLADLGKKRKCYVHRLVLEAFVGPCPPAMECRHLNGERQDNRLENLAWGTSSENNHDMVRHGSHYFSRRSQCFNGHLFDGIYYNADGTVKQRYCKTCKNARKPRKTLCPNGHEHDMVRKYADGSERPYCTKCQQGWLAETHAKRRAKTHCPHGHVLDGVQTGRNGRTHRYCKTCRREGEARRRAKKKLDTT